MCKECGRQICPSSCPKFDRRLAGIGSAVAVCALCGSSIYPNESFHRKGRVAICEECGTEMSVEELGIVCGTDDVLSLCGFEKVSEWEG